MAGKKKYYAVYKGWKPGIYDRWFGEGGAQEQVSGFSGAVYRGFPTRAEAEEFLRGKRSGKSSSKPSERTGPAEQLPGKNAGDGRVVIYTDGGALNNPGPGGYGVVIEDGKSRRELSGGFRLTTNNRMELLACIKALEALEKPSDVILFSDSRYVVDAVSKGWAKRWRKNNWMRNGTVKALNPDLWERLLNLLERHRVEFRWVRGHAGNAGNERCDALVRMESSRRDLPPDEIYEQLPAEDSPVTRK